MENNELGTFWKAHPEFLIGPALISGAYQAYWNAPQVAEKLAERGWAAYGVADTAMYTCFAIIMAYATHAWFTMHIGPPRQIQSYDGKRAKPEDEKHTNYGQRPPPVAAAVRTVAALLTSVVYASVPFAPATASWSTFIGWTFGFALYWDLHFFIIHKVVHENGTLYKWIHKLHHTEKQPHVFTAYFVTYQSHFLTEQMVIFLGAAMGLPRDVFTWTMWWGTLSTYIEHCGHDTASIRLSPLPITFGQLSTLLGPWSLVLGGETAAEHDWHHEKFTTNYALSFTYLDRLFNSFHPGRVAGVAIGADPASMEVKATKAAAAMAEERESSIAAATAAERPKMPTATYTQLQHSTTEDWLVQGAAFDKYSADGHVMRNVLQMVENMKGERGEIGAVVDMYEHSLQTATRARRAGADTETIVCALLHDVGEVLSATNHGEIASALLRPYITPLNHWLLSQHEVFQAYFFLDKCGGDKDLRDKVKQYKAEGIEKGHPYYEACARFCQEYDQPSFDPTYKTDSLESFKPLVEEVLSRTPFWWEPAEKKVEDLDPKARLASGYSRAAMEEIAACA